MTIDRAIRTGLIGLAVACLGGCYSAKIDRADLAILDVIEEVPVVPDLGPADPGTDGTPDVGPADTVPTDTVPTDTVPTDTVPADGTTDTLPDKDRPVGSACSVDNFQADQLASVQCATGQCLTTEYIGQFTGKVKIPGGMCTMLSCGTNADCEPGGVCIYVANISMSLCIQPCTVDTECRTGETYKCYKDQFDDYEGTQKVRPCMPEALITVMECDKECIPNPTGTCSLTGEKC